MRTKDFAWFRFFHNVVQKMSEQIKYEIRVMTEEDYDKVYELWMSIHGFGIRSIDDSREGISRFLKRNPTTSVVASVRGRENGEQMSGKQMDSEQMGSEQIVGAILCGHDGRRGCLYHVCVREDCRKQGIGKAMVVACMRALQAEQINKVSLIAFKNNSIGNQFWKGAEWCYREDLNYYDFTLNEENITRFNQ